MLYHLKVDYDNLSMYPLTSKQPLNNVTELKLKTNNKKYKMESYKYSIQKKARKDKGGLKRRWDK